MLRGAAPPTLILDRSAVRSEEETVMAVVIERAGSCIHCGAACDTRDEEGVWHCGTEHLLLARRGVPPITRPAPPRPAPAPVTDRYASLRAAQAHETASQRHAAVLRAAARRVRRLREHLEAGLDILAGGRREECVVPAVLVHPEVRDALADTLVTLRGRPPSADLQPPTRPAPAGDDPHLRALADVRELEAALCAAAAGQRDAHGRSRRAAVALLTYVDARLRRSGGRRVAA
jgi:hypothetical protein